MLVSARSIVVVAFFLWSCPCSSATSPPVLVLRPIRRVCRALWSVEWLVRGVPVLCWNPLRCAGWLLGVCVPIVAWSNGCVRCLLRSHAMWGRLTVGGRLRAFYRLIDRTDSRFVFVETRGVLSGARLSLRLVLVSCMYRQPLQ